ncbi:MAG: hypothetical protein HRT57_15735 [Crocinitomicaceae bacterium]|nr:hypothetical protein [Crocinitomicaceae bacterium]
MKKRGAIILGLTAFMFSSCIEHEVIPAPIPTVDLNCHFYGEINGAALELTENVLGYYNISTKDQIILAPPDFSSAVYYSKMGSPSIITSVEIGLGSVSWNANVSADPTTVVFNDFMNNYLTPPISNNGVAGFEFIYTDASNREWKSNQMAPSINAPNPDVEFISQTQDSDDSGDYSLFVCHFDCYAYSLNPDSLAILPVPVVHVDSILVQNAVYQGWFKR